MPFFLKISNKLPIIVPPPPALFSHGRGLDVAGRGGALRDDFTENLRFFFLFSFFFHFGFFSFFLPLRKKLTLFPFSSFPIQKNSTSSADRVTSEATRAEAEAEAEEAEATTATRDRGTETRENFPFSFSFSPPPLSLALLFSSFPLLNFTKQAQTHSHFVK